MFRQHTQVFVLIETIGNLNLPGRRKLNGY